MSDAASLKRVLVVDDDSDLRAVMSEALASEGYIVDAARNGVDALIRMREVLPDGLVLDLMMPVMDGRSLVKAMRSERTLAGIPFLLVSAAFDLEEACRSLSPGACLSKPYDVDVLLRTIGRLVLPAEGRARASTGHAPRRVNAARGRRRPS
jgi:DNA-binding response OmpR family regulator